MNTPEMIAAIAVMAFLTMALRFLPFVFFVGRETPAWITYLGKVLPYAMIGMLVVYCLKGIDFTRVSGFLPELIAGTATAVSYVLKRNTLLSVIGGTLLYMFLVQFVFI